MYHARALQRAIKKAGGVKALADLIGEPNRQTIINWRTRGVPANKCVAIETCTGVSRRELRADWPDYWPELIAPEPAKTVGVLRCGGRE